MHQEALVRALILMDAMSDHEQCNVNRCGGFVTQTQMRTVTQSFQLWVMSRCKLELQTSRI